MHSVGYCSGAQHQRLPRTRAAPPPTPTTAPMQMHVREGAQALHLPVLRHLFRCGAAGHLLTAAANDASYGSPLTRATAPMDMRASRSAHHAYDGARELRREQGDGGQARRLESTTSVCTATGLSSHRARVPAPASHDGAHGLRRERQLSDSTSESVQRHEEELACRNVTGTTRRRSARRAQPRQRATSLACSSASDGSVR